MSCAVLSVGSPVVSQSFYLILNLAHSLRFLFKTVYLCIYVHICVYMHGVLTGTKRVPRSTGVGVIGCSELLEIALGTEHGSSARIASVLNH